MTMLRCFILFTLAVSTSLTGCSQEPAKGIATQEVVTTETFNPDAAWDEFEAQFRLFYAYIDRDDFNVEQLLDNVENLARVQNNVAGFRDVLRRMSYAFTDPHLVVGPLSDTHYNVIPTSSDLIIHVTQEGYSVRDVRQDSPAFKAGVRPGWEVIAVNDIPLDTLIKENFTGLLDTLTDKQRAYMATVIAAGTRKGDRHLTFRHKNEVFSLTLPNPRDFAIALSKKPILTTSRGPKGEIGIIRINNSL